MPYSDNIKLSVIVLFYHGEKWIHSCVRSLERQTLPREMYEIILVDNGGSTPSVARYEGKPNIDVIRFSRNHGFTGGNNRALAQARGKIIFLMNQDSLAHANCLKEILSVSDSFPDAGIMASSMRMVSSEARITIHEPFNNTAGLFTLHRFGYAAYSVTSTQQPAVPVGFVSGNGLGFRRAILKDIGHYLFDERLGSYAEDLDLSLRIKKTGWKMVVCPRSVIYHYRDEAFSGKPAARFKKLFHISTNRLMVYYWNLTPNVFYIKFPFLLLGIPLKAARPDGAERLHLLKLFVSLLTLPFIILLFIIRLRQTVK